MSTEIKIPDIGGATDVDVIEILVNPGDAIAKDDSLITLEGDKATMEVPSPFEGTVENLTVKVGDKVSEGSVILTMNVSNGAAAESAKPEKKAEKKTEEKVEQKAEQKAEQQPQAKAESAPEQEITEQKDGLYAGPAVRRIAREFGIDLSQIAGSGHKGRIVKEDVQQYVKQRMQSGGLNVAAAPAVDFSKFGDTETQPLNKIKRLTGQFTHRSWVSIPHVTQFDEADITELENFRKAHKQEAEKQGVKLTPLVFIMKAVAKALKEFPTFNSSLDASGNHLILKKYFHIGVAVDTPNGLVVPVIRDVDQKGMMVLAKELAAISQKAREKGLSPAEMAGNCFTISSLGGIGGTAFTPIINGTDVAILGVSRAKMQPVYQKDQFIPRLMLPMSLSYDHRVIDGAEAARFSNFLAKSLSDIRTLLL